MAQDEPQQQQQEQEQEQEQAMGERETGIIRTIADLNELGEHIGLVLSALTALDSAAAAAMDRVLNLPAGVQSTQAIGMSLEILKTLEDMIVLSCDRAVQLLNSIQYCSDGTNPALLEPSMRFFVMVRERVPFVEKAVDDVHKRGRNGEAEVFSWFIWFCILCFLVFDSAQYMFLMVVAVVELLSFVFWWKHQSGF